MRDVRTYQINTAAAPTSRAVLSCGSVHATYTASGSVVPIATQRAIRAARRRTRSVHSAQRPPMGMPATNSPHLAHGCLGPMGHGASKLGGCSTAPPILGPHVVLDDCGLDRSAQPVAPPPFPPLVEHHGGREHLGGRVGDPPASDVRRGAVHRPQNPPPGA